MLHIWDQPELHTEFQASLDYIGTVYFGPQCWRFQPMVVWLHCSRAVVGQGIMAGSMCWSSGLRGWRGGASPQGVLPQAYFPQRLQLTSFYQLPN